MKYDDASWHYGGNFPQGLDEAAGATHIGMFVSWCLINGLAGDLHTEQFPDDLQKLVNREETPGQWFIRNCDEKFTDEDLNDLGNKFAQFYYASEKAPYLSVYERAVGSEVESLYEVPDTWEVFEVLAPEIAAGFEAWSAHG